MAGIVDPGNNYAFEAHQYLDYDYSGTHTNIGNSVAVPDATVGATRLVAFTHWLRINGYKGFLGEFAVDNSMIGNGSSQIGDEALTNMLSYIQTNSDVWLGWSWWGGGPWWSANSLFHIDPANFTNPVDKPVMTVIKNFFPVPVPLLVSTNTGQFQFAAQPGFCISTANFARFDEWQLDELMDLRSQAAGSPASARWSRSPCRSAPILKGFTALA